MTSIRTRRKSSIALLCAAVAFLAACSSEDEKQPEEKVTTATKQSDPERNTPTRPVPDSTETIMPTVRSAPDPVDGLTEDAAIVTAQRCIEQWVQFSPSRPDAKQYWFSSWEKSATSEFRASMRRQADPLWSWTWNQGKKTCCVEFPGKPEAVVGDKAAVAKVTLTRWVMPIEGTQAEIEQAMTQEEKTYLIWMTARGEKFSIDRVDEVPADAVLPSEV